VTQPHVTRQTGTGFTTSVKPTDAALVQRVLEGDVESFAVLVERHHERCLRIAVRLLGNSEDAEETVQDAFVRAYRALGRYEEREQFGPWLTRILVNRCRTAMSRRVRHGKTFVDDELAIAGAAARDRTDGEMWRAEVERALAALPVEQREAFVLKHVEELEYEAIAEITGVGVSALKMRVMRARERLRALLEGDQER
jgi:RNA polymerase sigma-70 factor (ECF subfamily)